MNVRCKIDVRAPPRVEALARLPVFLALAGKRVVVAGGSAAAAWKAELLAAAGASIDVYAETFCEELRALGEASGRTRVNLHARAWRSEDLVGAAVAIGDFVEKQAAARFAQAARAAGILVNVIDKPVFCDFSFGAIVNRSPLVIGISTDGAAPAFAQAIRTRLETLIPRGFGRWAAAAQRWRVRMSTHRLSFTVRRRFWQNFANVAMTQPEREPQPAFFADLLDRSVRDDAPLGDITVISPVPHDAELLTLRAVRALACADVLLVEADVGAGVLDFARREAERIFVHGLSEAEIAAHMRTFVDAGKRIVRLGTA